MDEDLTTAVDDYRRRIGEQAREVQRLQGLVVELEAQSHHPSHARAKSTLRHAMADLSRAQHERSELKRTYARFRLREGIGRDPASVDDDTFDQELLVFCTGPLTRRTGRDPHQGAIAFECFRQMLLADLPLGQLAENERAERKADVSMAAIEEDYATKRILRQWAAMTQSDPYVSATLRRAAAAAERFTRSLADFEHGLNDLRVNYEISTRTTDGLAFVFDGQRAVIRAENDWESVQHVFPEDSRRLVEQFHALRQAHRELTTLREELKSELRAFVACFVPYCVTYHSRQSRPRRRRLGLRRFNPRRLCDYLLEEVERTDFLLPDGGGLEVALPRIPREIATFARTDAYRQFQRSLGAAELAEASKPAQKA